VRDGGVQYQFSNVLWFPTHSPKVAMCLLRALNVKLLARDLLMSIGVSDTDICVLCGSAEESVQHLFFVCPFSAYLWALCGLKLGILGSISTLQDEAMNIQSRFKIKTNICVLAKHILSAAVWHIWKRRISEYSNYRSRTTFWCLGSYMRILDCC